MLVITRGYCNWDIFAVQRLKIKGELVDKLLRDLENKNKSWHCLTNNRLKLRSVATPCCQAYEEVVSCIQNQTCGYHRYKYSPMIKRVEPKGTCSLVRVLIPKRMSEFWVNHVQQNQIILQVVPTQLWVGSERGLQEYLWYPTHTHTLYMHNNSMYIYYAIINIDPKPSIVINTYH